MGCVSIRQLATSLSGERIAAGEFEHKVHIWDLASKKHICSFDTILDYGGARLAISADGQCCVAGAYNTYGVVCYSSDNGAEVWRRADLKKAQSIRFSQDDTRIIIEIDDKPCHILDRKTGQTIITLRGTKDIIESPFEPIALLINRKNVELRTLQQEKIMEILHDTISELDITFAIQHVCVSESAGPIRCWNTETRDIIWMYHEDGRHVLNLCYEPLSQAFIGVDWNYEKGGNHRLMRFDVITGHWQIVSELGSSGGFAFCLSGKSLLTTDGSIIDTLTGLKYSQLWPSVVQ